MSVLKPARKKGKKKREVGNEEKLGHNNVYNTPHLLLDEVFQLPAFDELVLKYALSIKVY